MGVGDGKGANRLTRRYMYLFGKVKVWNGRGGGREGLQGSK